ncbi:MAG TPA: hypothetical protein VFB55_13905, partial [Verrucomicrobiae bacterium]|nr:hypothetical protein [Verrucomicrobiae bacterium]
MNLRAQRQPRVRFEKATSHSSQILPAFSGLFPSKPQARLNESERRVRAARDLFSSFVNTSALDCHPYEAASDAYQVRLTLSAQAKSQGFS